MINNWDEVNIMPEFSKGGVSCYKLGYGGESGFTSRYYIVTSEGTRKLMNSPEVVGYGVQRAMFESTSCMLSYFAEKGWISNASILTILRGGLNFPIEEACYKEGIDVSDMSFVSCERVFTEDGQLNGLDIKYSKIAKASDASLLIGDILASGDTMVKCLEHVISYYKENGMSLRNIVFFTIGGTYGISLMEELTEKIRKDFPEFEGFICVYYEGVFSCYEPGDFGVSGINRPLIDFIWRDGIVAPEFRQKTLSARDPLFEKCIIYDGGARRYEIGEHVEEVLEFWNGILERAESIDFKALLEEKLGHELPISYEEWVKSCHYVCLPETLSRKLYEQEQKYVSELEGVTLEQIARERIREFSEAMRKYE